MIRSPNIIPSGTKIGSELASRVLGSSLTPGIPLMIRSKNGNDSSSITSGEKKNHAKGMTAYM